MSLSPELDREAELGFGDIVEDEIIAEVRAAREALAAEHGYDVSRLSAALEHQRQMRLAQEERPVMAPCPKRLTETSS